MILVRWSPFEKELLIRLTVCSLCIMSVILVFSNFGFVGETLVLIYIAPVPGHGLFCFFLLLVLIVLLSGLCLLLCRSRNLV